MGNSDPGATGAAAQGQGDAASFSVALAPQSYRLLHPPSYSVHSGSCLRLLSSCGKLWSPGSQKQYANKSGL